MTVCFCNRQATIKPSGPGAAMGKALEWLGPDGCATVAEQILTVIQHRGGEIWAACPFHQESTPGNAFSYAPHKDAAYCNSCGTKGDLIQVFGAVRGLDHSQAFIDFRSAYAPHVSSQGRPFLRTPRQKTAPPVQEISARESHLPPDAWQAKARALVDDAHAALLTSPAQLKWLEDRGISLRSVHRYRLGWIAEDMFRARSTWGLPEEIKDNGQPKKLWIPAGLTIPCLHGETVLRVRIRQPERDPKYYVLPGSAQNPAPLMCLPDSWPGQNHACIVVEAELDGILVAQEAGDLVSVLAVGSATNLPRDTRSVEFARSMAWFGLWLDRDSAGDKGVRRWLESLLGGEAVDGGYVQALGVSGRDIRPVGQGKMDPGDCHKQGLSVRDIVRAALPRAWAVSSAVTTVAPGSVIQGDDPAAQKTGAEYAPGVIRFGKILAGTPIVCRVSDEISSIMAYRRRADGRWMQDEDGSYVQDVSWEMMHWAVIQEASRLFWHDPDVWAYVCAHPDAAVGISGKNFWKKEVAKND